MRQPLCNRFIKFAGSLLFFGFFSLCKALAAIIALAFHRLKRNSCRAAALGACGIIVFSAGFYGVLARLSALFAALRLVLETFLSVKFLLAGSENKFVATIFAD